ncbi:Hypothetical predicted protein, partial [Marmota monax]
PPGWGLGIPECPRECVCVCVCPRRARPRTLTSQMEPSGCWAEAGDPSPLTSSIAVGSPPQLPTWARKDVVSRGHDQCTEPESQRIWTVQQQNTERGGQDPQVTCSHLKRHCW